MAEEPETERVGAADRAVIARQLRREPHDLTGVAVRCPFGRPAVIETAPVLSTGEPNPTLLYLTCPTVVAAISRVEGEGGVRRFKEAVESDAGLRTVLETMTEWYRARRAALAGRQGAAPRSAGAAEPGRHRLAGPGHSRLDAGIGGPREPGVASCLHAYAAALLAVRSGWLSGPRPAALGPPQPVSGTAAPGPPGSTAAPGPPADTAALIWDRFFPPLEACWCTDDRCASAAASPGGAGRPRRVVAAAGGARATGRRAAIDVGTISVRLLVADLSGGRPQPLVRRAHITRLGEGLVRGAPFAAAAAARTAAAVRRFAQEARQLGAQTVWLAGTSAARDAADGEAFITGLGKEIGATAAVLSGEEEAALAYAGAGLDVPGDHVVLDVGGGSTELIRAGEAASLDLGAERSTARWIRGDPPAAGEVEAVAGEAAAAVAPLRDRFGPAGGPLVGVAGTVTTLACLDAGPQAYDPDVVHLWELDRDAVAGLLERLSRLTTAQRAGLPCIQAGRAPVIVAGAAIVRAVMESLGHTRLLVSERDLLDGLVLCGLTPWYPLQNG
jgi:exopolyphosphatase/guanosine-5'-triphosphate,3'-diphosphate pyrophosphatase